MMSENPNDRDPRRVSPHPVLTAYYRDEAGHRRFLTRLFDDTASQYDRISGLMSLGSGAWYRRYALRRAGLTEGMKVLDVAVGTGAFASAAMTIVGPWGSVVGVDPSTGMLAQAHKKLGIRLSQGVAEALPFRDEHFDFTTMGYALASTSAASCPGWPAWAPAARRRGSSCGTAGTPWSISSPQRRSSRR